ncbi:hypothetical protein GY45DRAFT_326441 [Cubamyces sp. BRFM 1775]|nr:hypothetical protein GY45DRAFT_326441 [Cubamyces sp. BRFM 1775]
MPRPCYRVAVQRVPNPSAWAATGRQEECTSASPHHRWTGFSERRVVSHRAIIQILSVEARRRGHLADSSGMHWVGCFPGFPSKLLSGLSMLLFVGHTRRVISNEIALSSDRLGAGNSA